MGYKFIGIDNENNMVVEVRDPNKPYTCKPDYIIKKKLLHILEFNSNRKRMSVIL